jgi:hypothetical protein
VSPKGDKDYFILTTPEDGLLNIVLDHGGSNRSFSIRLYQKSDAETAISPIENRQFDRGHPEFVFNLKRGDYILELSGAESPSVLALRNVFSGISEESDIRMVLVGLGLKQEDKLDRSLSEMAEMTNSRYLPIYLDDKRDIENVLYSAAKYSIGERFALPEISSLISSQLAEELTEAGQLELSAFSINVFEMAAQSVVIRNDKQFDFMAILNEMISSFEKKMKRTGGDK